LPKFQYDSFILKNDFVEIMKLTRTGWNNVIIISVMLMILLINFTSDRLFPESNSVTNTQGEQMLFAEHAVILTLIIDGQIKIERLGQTWQVKQLETQKIITSVNQQVLEQTMRAWQQTAGLLQASTIEITGLTGLSIKVYLAGQQEVKKLTLYPLDDQLLIKDGTEPMKEKWFALPSALYAQFIPEEFLLLLNTNH
jgi:hypothetical protein